ncbi:MAG: PDZ domain-containing protein [Planctomycetes bacterium]|nr:PDZ domain-containing protein [Planctomycetota bacterium]
MATLSVALAPFAPAQDGPTDVAKAHDILARMGAAQGDALWDLSLELEQVGAPAADSVSDALKTARGGQRLALAKTLLAIGDDGKQSLAIQSLRDVVRGDDPRELRVLACDLLMGHARRNDVLALKREVDGVRDPYVKIALLKLLKAKRVDKSADTSLREYLRSEDAGVRYAAALALAETGNVDVAKMVLHQLKDEPTPRGRRAAAYLEQEKLLAQVEEYSGVEGESAIVRQLKRQLEDLEGQNEELVAKLRSGIPEGGAQGGGESFEGAALLREIMQRIEGEYVDGEKTDPRKLLNAAASGLVDSLDPFSSYMSKESLADFSQDMNQEYGGIGAVIGKDPKTEYLTIQRPFPGAPAYEAGLRTLDVILKVGEVDTREHTVADLVDKLKGKPGTEVEITVKRFMNDEEFTLKIKREQVTINSVRHDMLPGQVGYLQLTTFGQYAAKDVEGALADLEGRGMRGLIFDLRGNGGGYLREAVMIADKFLNDDQLVVYQEGRKGSPHERRKEDGGPRIAPLRRAQPKHPDYPLVFLVDENTASASEIVSGALQHHQRAVLVGARTFGKGSVQNVMPLDSENQESALRLTIAYYYLPDGRCIHRTRDVETWRFNTQMRFEIERWKREGKLNAALADELLERYKPAAGGVEPDYAVELPDFPQAVLRALGPVYDLQLLEGYVKAQWLEHKDLFHRLALGDAFDPHAYPHFDALWDQVQAKLDEAGREALKPEHLRRALRAMVRRFAQDDLQRELTSDYQEDRQLQAAIVVLAEELGLNLAEQPEMKFIPERFPEGVKRTREIGAGTPDDKPEEGRKFK